MIKTLQAAFKKQCNHEPFGQADLDGSFVTLVKRGLVDILMLPVNGEPSRVQAVWYVTKEGIGALHNLGYA